MHVYSAYKYIHIRLIKWMVVNVLWIYLQAMPHAVTYTWTMQLRSSSQDYEDKSVLFRSH